MGKESKITIWALASIVFVFICAGVFLFFYFYKGKTETLHILWAAGTPSVILHGATKDFTSQTGILVTVDAVPWSDFEKVAYHELDSDSPKYDLIIGDSQWLGRNVEKGGKYVELTSFVKENNLTEKIAPSAMKNLSEYPEGSGRYYSVPMLEEGMGFAYRKDLFESSSEKQAFKSKFGYELSVPDTWAKLRDIAEFFNRPKSGLYGISFPTSNQYDYITMTFENILFSFGGDIGDRKTLQSDGIINGPKSVKALKFFKELYAFSSQKDGRDDTATAPAKDIISGKTAMSLSYFTFFGDLVDSKKNPYFDKTGYFAVPKGDGGAFSALGGQGASIVSGSKNKNSALKFLEWWIMPETQKKWVEKGGVPVSTEMLDSTLFRDIYPYNNAERITIGMVKDFWTTPEYSELLKSSQNILYGYLKGHDLSAQESLDNLSKEWQEIFKASSLAYSSGLKTKK